MCSGNRILNLKYDGSNFIITSNAISVSCRSLDISQNYIVTSGSNKTSVYCIYFKHNSNCVNNCPNGYWPINFIC